MIYEFEKERVERALKALTFFFLLVNIVILYTKL